MLCCVRRTIGRGATMSYVPRQVLTEHARRGAPAFATAISPVSPLLASSDGRGAVRPYDLPATYRLPTDYLPTTYRLPTYYLHAACLLPPTYLPTYDLPTTHQPTYLPTYLPTY